VYEVAMSAGCWRDGPTPTMRPMMHQSAAILCHCARDRCRRERVTDGPAPDHVVQGTSLHAQAVASVGTAQAWAVRNAPACTRMARFVAEIFGRMKARSERGELPAWFGLDGKPVQTRGGSPKRLTHFRVWVGFGCVTQPAQIRSAIPTPEGSAHGSPGPDPAAVTQPTQAGTHT